MRAIGFSTGSLAHGDFRRALEMLRESSTTAIELSALRFNELAPLVASVAELDLAKYTHVSLHAPSSYPAELEDFVIDHLTNLIHKWFIVLHPDAAYDLSKWRTLGNRLLIENMDKRKSIGRTSSELEEVFEILPEAGLCFDLAHARQVDPSMTEAYSILRSHKHRVRQVHVSEVGTSSYHTRISYAAMLDYREVVWDIPANVPIILETPVSPEDLGSELARVYDIFAEVEPQFDMWSKAAG